MKLKVNYLFPDMPELFSKDGDSGFDVRAAINFPIVLKAKSRVTVKTGIAVEIDDLDLDEHWSAELQVRHRSGLTSKGIVAQFGTIDISYRGEIAITLFNFSDEDVTIEPLDRIAQVVVCPILKPSVVTVDILSQTERGNKGFGSTGLK